MMPVCPFKPYSSTFTGTKKGRKETVRIIQKHLQTYAKSSKDVKGFCKKGFRLVHTDLMHNEAESTKKTPEKGTELDQVNLSCGHNYFVGYSLPLRPLFY
ncbi:hypothetical protein ATANTOWER_022203 [Ataeniobius toweri]|uniref:Uncharacterized protein n=1 Tax=Ataeniobius toweri TaxID=208326 RepID=A0ABU7ALM2_9TELE|nr:hypothetical protein [Ataeniobius toweri]